MVEGLRTNAHFSLEKQMKKQWWSTVALVVVVGTWGCGDDDNGDADSTERPLEAQELVSDELLAEFEAAGASVYLGMSAPDISGMYLFDDPEVQYTESERWPGTTSWCHHMVTYEQGESEYQYTESGFSTNCDSEFDGLSNYISGDDGCFTLYGEISGSFEGCASHGVSIFSACVDDNGDFLDPQDTSVALSVDGDSCDQIISDGRLRDEGEIAIMLQSDGKAVRQ